MPRKLKPSSPGLDSPGMPMAFNLESSNSSCPLTGSRVLGMFSFASRIIPSERFISSPTCSALSATSLVVGLMACFSGLLRRLIEAYLDSCSAKSRAQLLLTTHDVILMDQDILRRDEMWVAERDDLGASSLISFNEYKDIRYDKDTRKSYMQGRLGGIPQILFSGSLAVPHQRKIATNG